MTNYSELSLKYHEKYKGKVWTISKVPLNNKDDLATYYSPGVAEPCLQIAQDPSKAYLYTRKKNSVAVVSDGTAVLWLGNIGWLAWLPVMEGKAILFKHFGNIDAIPIVLGTQDPDEIIKTIINIAPTFGGINLEDIAAPACFYIEEQLKQKLSIPVFHDDQHGTAIVVLAWLINALTITNKTIDNIKIVVSGAGAAWIATVLLLKKAWAKHIITFDSKGAIHNGRTDLNIYKQSISDLNINQESWTLTDCIKNADVFIGVSQPSIIDRTHIASMNTDPIVFWLSNPIPEIMPEEAKAWWAKIIATGRSDFPNQINNILAFPGLFKGVLEAGITQITDDHKLAAAYALAGYIQNPTTDMILPSALDKEVVTTIAQAVKNIG